MTVPGGTLFVMEFLINGLSKIDGVQAELRRPGRSLSIVKANQTVATADGNVKAYTRLGLP